MRKSRGIAKSFVFFPVNNYLVFYRVEDESSTVYVVRIMYSGRISVSN